MPAGDEIGDLWQEYELGQTEEAKLVKDFDKASLGAAQGGGKGE